MHIIHTLVDAFYVKLCTRKILSERVGGGVRTREIDLSCYEAYHETTGDAGIYLGRVDATVLLQQIQQMPHPARLKEDAPPLARVKPISGQGVLVRGRFNKRKHHLNERYAYRQRASIQLKSSETRESNEHFK